MFNRLQHTGYRIKVTGLICVFAMATAQADLPDPTRPPDASLTGVAGEADMAVSKTFLSSILISPERRVAIINGKVLRKGDQVGGGRIVNIKPSEVILKVGNETEVLTLLPKVLKVPTRKAGYE